MSRLPTTAPATKETFKALVDQLTTQHPGLRDRTSFYLLRTPSKNNEAVASMAGDGKFGTLHLLFELLGCPEFASEGFLVRKLGPIERERFFTLFTAFHAEAQLHPNVAFLEQAVQRNEEIECVIVNREAADDRQRERFLQYKTTLLFELFNDGILRGSDGLARQALLDAFGTLPNRFLSPDGHFLLSTADEPQFMRTVPSYGELTSASSSIGGIDKFPSLMHVRGERLKADGNRIVPSAMIRDGVYIGKRNIFMFHAAVNIAAYIGDDNLIDSHASIASAAQLGNKNKIGSFVSLEGVLSPANAVPVFIGDENFIGSFARIGTGIKVGDKNFIASGVNLSLGTKLRDCREASSTRGDYVTPKELNGEGDPADVFKTAFNNLAIVPNNACRTFNGVELVPGEYALFANTEEFMKRFEGDTRIKSPPR